MHSIHAFDTLSLSLWALVQLILIRVLSICVRLSAGKEGDCTSGHCSQHILGLHVVCLFLLHCGSTAANYRHCGWCTKLCQLWSGFLILLSSGLGECSSLSCCRSCTVLYRERERECVCVRVVQGVCTITDSSHLFLYLSCSAGSGTSVY